MADEKTDKAPAPKSGDPAASEAAGPADSEAKTLAPGEGVDGDGNVVTGYVGVDPMYANFANSTEAPGVAEEGPEKHYDERALALQAQTAQANSAVGVLGYSGSPGSASPPQFASRAEELAYWDEQYAKDEANRVKQRRDTARRAQ